MDSEYFWALVAFLIAAAIIILIWILWPVIGSAF
jgi:hypothetical protein